MLLSILKALPDLMFSMSFRRRPESCDNVNKDPGFRRDDKDANRLGHMRGCRLKVGSRFRGNDKNYYVIPAKAGIQYQSGAKKFEIYKNTP